LAIEVNQSLTGDHLVEVLQAIAQQGRQLPSRIHADKGPEFVSISLDMWAYGNDVVSDFSRPGKPTDNPFIGSFNGSFRDKSLSVHRFLSLKDACAKIETWSQDYKCLGPHSALSDAEPVLFASHFKGSTNGRNL
jgi:putative transposase